MGNEQYKKKDEALLAAVSRVKSGDASAWAEMYELSSKYLYKIIYDIVKDTTTTEDLLQETYLQIYNKIDTLQEAGAFYVWAGRIATNYTLRYLQKYRKEVLVTADDEGNTDYAFENASEDNELFIPETVMQDAETRRLMAEILDALPVAQKLTIQYYYYEEMSVHEIAEAMETTDGTVKSRLNYARKAIKDAVLDLEKNKDTKLYSLASLPLFYLFFRESIADFFAEGSAAAASVATATNVAIEASGSSVAAGAGEASTAASTAASTTATETAATASSVAAKSGAAAFFATTAGKVTIGIVAAALVAGGVGTGVAVSRGNRSAGSEAGSSIDTEGTSNSVSDTEEIDINSSENYELIINKLREQTQLGEHYVDKYGCVILEQYENGELVSTGYYTADEEVYLGTTGALFKTFRYGSRELFVMGHLYTDLVESLDLDGTIEIVESMTGADAESRFYVAGFGFELMPASAIQKVEALADGGWKVYTDGGVNSSGASYGNVLYLNSEYEIVKEEYTTEYFSIVRFDADAKNECESIIKEMKAKIQEAL